MTSEIKRMNLRDSINNKVLKLGEEFEKVRLEKAKRLDNDFNKNIKTEKGLAIYDAEVIEAYSNPKLMDICTQAEMLIKLEMVNLQLEETKSPKKTIKQLN
jgi:hypothetical protein